MSNGTNREAVFAVGGLAAWGVLGGLYFALGRSPSPAQSAAQASASAPVAPLPPAPSNGEFREYLRELGAVVMTAVNATEGISICIEDEETAPREASGALTCLRGHAARMREANAGLRAIRPPADQRERHAAIVAVSDDGIRGLDAYTAAFAEAAPALDRLRRRQTLQRFYTTSDRDEVTGLQGRTGPMEAAFGRWVSLLGPFNVRCNERLRCFSAWGRAARGEPPPDFRPVERAKNNCPCARAWNSLSGEGHEAILTAEESGLPPFEGGIL